MSEQITETDPKVSTVLSDLQRILCLRIMLALMVMLAVTATGRPSGMKATATETHEMIKLGTLIQSGWSCRNHVALLIVRHVTLPGWGGSYQTTTTRIIMKAMMEQMITTKLKTSLSSVVIPFLGSLVSFAILPKIVLSLVATTTPVHVPAMQ